MVSEDPVAKAVPAILAAAGRLAEAAGVPAGVGIASAVLEWGASAVLKIWEEHREQVVRSPIPLSSPSAELPDPVLKARLQGSPALLPAAARALESAEPAALREVWGLRKGGPGPGETFSAWIETAPEAARRELLDRLLARSPDRLRAALRIAESRILQALSAAIPRKRETESAYQALDTFLRLAAESPSLLKDPRVREALERAESGKR